MDREEAVRREEENRRAQLTKDLLDKRYYADEAAREHALKVLADAKVARENRRQEYEKAKAEWVKAKDALQSSQNTLNNSNRMLDQLGREKLDLVRSYILNESGDSIKK